MSASFKHAFYFFHR